MHHFWYHVLGRSIRDLGLGSYAILAFIVMIEGPTATLIGAVAAASGFLDPIPVFISSAGGNLTGDVLWYSLGRAGKLQWLVKYFGWLGVREADVTRLRTEMRENVRTIIFFAKITLVFALPALIATGLTKVPIKRWLPVDVIAECIWTGSLVAIGYFGSRAIGHIETGLELVPLLGFAACIGVVARFAARRRFGMPPDRRKSPPLTGARTTAK